MPEEQVVKRLSILDRFLPVWIIVAMGIGILLGYIYPGIADIFDRLRIGTVSLPIAVGLLWMMYPYSAGTFPKGVNPLAVEVMKEKGIDISGHRSKNISLFTGNRFDYVITVCDNARELCPVFPGDTRHINWSFTDPATFNGPADKRLNTFRTVRDEIESKIIWFIEQQSVV